MQTDLTAKNAMTIANAKVVHVIVTTHVRVSDVVILVDLHRVARRNTLLGCKRELRNVVFDFLLRERVILVYSYFWLSLLWRFFDTLPNLWKERALFGRVIQQLAVACSVSALQAASRV